MNRDPEPKHGDPSRIGYIFEKPCRKCRKTFTTLNPNRDICPGCVHKSQNPTPLNEPI